ncbi:MAG: galactose-1-phosphate uridylyltransferase, partial [Negativicutes bacterium]|nr:galactose-1-phosphate uridylyltransferase [Negativicutes bacterium]
MDEKKLLVEKIIGCAVDNGVADRRDVIFLRNRLYTILGWENDGNTPQLPAGETAGKRLSELVSELCDLIGQAGRDGLGESREQVETRLIGEIVPPPSAVERQFAEILRLKGGEGALTWYYQFSQHTDYIKVAAIARNRQWTSATVHGEMEITINLSKPEKDPLEIARLKARPAASYPKCLLCIENEGFCGNINNRPARHNHRMLRLDLAGREWYFQFSPYLYYPEHSILINPEHRDMVIDSDVIANFLAFVDMFPHYLIGSNSDIPIVGGSILNHDHYQAGSHRFPVERAGERIGFAHPRFPEMIFSYLNWPVSTLKITGHRAGITAMFDEILAAWYGYQNPAIGIVRQSAAGERHNGITPIMRK